MIRFLGKRIKHTKKNNAGLTLTEMIVTFALLAIFMVAATRVISYVIGIYYAASGNSYGLQVSNMVAGQIIGQMEKAGNAQIPKITAGAGGIDSISLTDDTGSQITITAAGQPDASKTPQGMYMVMHYGEVTEGSIQYEAVDFRLDAKAYMGYVVKQFRLEDPGDAYPDNVIKMTLVLGSDRYGDYTTTHYIKCLNVEKFEFL